MRVALSLHTTYLEGHPFSSSLMDIQHPVIQAGPLLDNPPAQANHYSVFKIDTIYIRLRLVINRQYVQRMTL